MSATIPLKILQRSRTDPALHLAQHGWLTAVLILVFGALSVFARDSAPPPEVRLPELAILSSGAPEPEAAPQASASALSPSLQAALNSVARRYRVSPEALKPIFSLAQLVGSERHIDPLLIVAVIAVESGFNPFAESVKGAQGLMQVMPRLHLDKLPDGADSAGQSPLLDPAINIRVGVHVLEEAIRRNGGLEAGLLSYAGATDPDSMYASRVLAEKERLEQAARLRATS
jgi:soluble lytic murein transglycosylase-like protein